MKKSFFACLICLSAPAYGQDKSTPEESEIVIMPLSKAEAIATDNIVVTGRRNIQTRLEVPAKIEKIAGRTLDKIAPVHPAEALNSLSGVHIHRGSGLEHLTSIRSPILTGGAGAGSFLYLQDGISLRSAGFSNVNGLFEAHTELSAGLEVYKGPGSVLYGSNALHGMINSISRLPDGSNQARLLVGEDGYYSVALRHSDMNHSGADYAINLALAHDDGFRESSGYDQQKLSAIVETDFGKWDVRWQAAFQNLNQETAGFIRGTDAYRDDAIRFTNPNPEAYRDSKSFRSNLRLEKPYDNGNRLVLMPYMRWTDMEFLRHFVPGQATEKVGHWSVGALNTYYGHNYTLGFDAEYTQGYVDEFQDGPRVFSFVQGAHYDYEVDALTLAAYGEYEFELDTSRLTKITIGGRAEYVDYAYDNKIDTVDVGRFRRVDDRSDAYFVITPKITLSRELSDNIHGYVRAVRGARAPQVSDLYSLQTQQQPGEIETETLDSLEAGIKAVYSDVRFELAAFTMKKDNFFFRNADGLNVTNGKTDHIGIEADFSAELSPWLTLSGSGTLARHRYDFDDPASQIMGGNRVDTAPDTIATLNATITPVDNLSTEIEWRHMGSYFTDPGNRQSYPGHDVFVARAGYDISDGVRVFWRIDNLFDEKYADRADFAFGSERYFPGRPRTVFFGVEQTF